MRPFQNSLIKFCIDVFGIALTVTRPKLLVLSFQSVLAALLGYCCAHFGVLFLNFLRTVQHFYPTFCTVVLDISLMITALGFFSNHVPFCCRPFWHIFGLKFLFFFRTFQYFLIKLYPDIHQTRIRRTSEL